MLEKTHNLDYDEAHFLQQIRKELSLESSQEVVPLVASVLQSLRQTLTLQNANDLMNKLPDFLKVIFACNWQTTESQVPVKHLDEFVNLVMERDQRSQKFLFKSEVQTLNVIILTLKKIYHFIDLGNIEGISRSFKQELWEAATEVAA